MRGPPGRFLPIYLSAYIRLSLVVLAFAASCAQATPSLSINSPAAVESGAETEYAISIRGLTGTESGISAMVTMPEGFSFSGSEVIWPDGSGHLIEPEADGRNITWDLSQAISAINSGKHIVINEFEQNPPGSDKGNEWIELYNPTSNSVSVGGWRLIESDKGRQITIPSGKAIQPFGYYVIFWDNGELINSRPVAISLISSALVDTTISATGESKDDNECWARVPNGHDTDSDSDWKLKRSTWAANNDGDESDLPGEYSLRIKFNMTAGHEAPGGQRIHASLTYNGITISASSGPIALKGTDLVLELHPDVTEAAMGEEVVWTLIIDNAGQSLAHDVLVDGTLGAGLSLTEIDSPGGGMSWSYSEIGAGDGMVVHMRTRVVSSSSLTCHISLKWTSAGILDQEEASEDVRYYSISPGGLGLSISVPEGVEANVSDKYSITITSSYAKLFNSASLEAVMPEGFTYSGGSNASFLGSSHETQPQVQGQSLVWDLSTVPTGRCVVINEFEPNPDGDDPGNEWVELYNPTPQAVSIGGWKIIESYVTSSGNPTTKTVTLPAGEAISPWGHYVVRWTDGALVNSNMNLRLTDAAFSEMDHTPDLADGDDNAICCDNNFDVCCSCCSWSRSPDGFGEWELLKSTPGGSNCGFGSCSMAVDFNLTAGENATGGQTLSATLRYAGGELSAVSSPIAIKMPEIELMLYPDVTEAGLGDEVSWTVNVENTGPSPASDVQVSCTLGGGLRLTGSSPPGDDGAWSYPRMESGGIETIVLSTKVVSLMDLSTRISASWIHGGHLKETNVSSEIEPSSYSEPGLDLSVPGAVNINEPVDCSLGISGVVFDPEDDLLAGITIPEGFYFSGKGQVYSRGEVTSIMPEIEGRSLSCYLSPALQSQKGIVINEILPSPNESTGTGDECLEIYNAGASSVNISGWFIKNSAGRYVSASIASGRAIMKPGSYLPVTAAYHSLPDDGGEITLYDSSGDPRDVEVYPGFKQSDKGKSYSRLPDGSDSWAWTAPSLGSSNGAAQLRIDFGIMASANAPSGQPVEADLSCNGITYRQSRSVDVNTAPVVLGNMSLSLSAPSTVYLSEPRSFSLTIMDEGAQSKDITARVSIPVGFELSGNSTVTISGKELQQVLQAGGSALVWDLKSIAGRSRHLMVNKFEQSPPGDGERWVELYNPTPEDVVIGGWKIKSRCNGQERAMPDFADAIVPSGGYYVVACSRGFLSGSYPTSITLCDSLGSEVDCTPEKTDEYHDDRCWARYPNGLGDWRLIPAARGESNGGSCGDLYPEGSAIVRFNLTAECGAATGQNISADVSHATGSLSAISKPISLKYGDLKINQTTDVEYADKGEKVVWTVYIENTGDAPVHDISVGDSAGKGLILQSISSPDQDLNWSYSSIGPGQNETFQVEAIVNASAHLYNQVDVHWGCGSQYKYKKTYVKFKNIIKKTPDRSRDVAIGQEVDYLISVGLPKAEISNLVINNTLPGGLIYRRESLNATGATLLGESLRTSADDPDGTLIEWHFTDVEPSAKVELGFNATLANSIQDQDGTLIEDGNATVSFSDEDGKVIADSDTAGPITVVEPDLSINKTASSPKGQMKENQTYLLIISHSPASNAAAFDVDVEDLIPQGMSYVPGSIRILAGPPGRADDSNPRVIRWHFDEIPLSKAKSKRVQLRYNATLTDSMGSIRNNATVTWSSMPGQVPGERDGSGGLNDYRNSTTCQVLLPSLSISKTGSPNPVYAGDLLHYTITYQNLGAIAARNVVIRDEYDSGVAFVSSDPKPSDAGNSTWAKSSGIPELLLPGQTGYINITVQANESLANGTMLRNRFAISSDDTGIRSGVIYTEALARSVIRVNKVALQKEAKRGEDISYAISVCNRGGLPARNVTIRDLFDSRVELVSVSPEPSADGAWHIGLLNPGECMKISLKVRIPRTEVAFSMEQSVSGVGFVNAAQDYSTSLDPYMLTNHVTVSSDGNALVTGSAKVKILGEPGTSLKTREHGSGSFSSEMALRFLTKNKSIQMEEEMQARYSPAVMEVEGRRTIDLSSEWSRAVYARNEVIGSSITESYRGSTSLDCQSRLSMDQNFSSLAMNSSFDGSAHIGYLKRAGVKSRPVFESLEDYSGRFMIDEHTDDYGLGYSYNRSSYGRGFVSINRNIRDLQKVVESGTGDYGVEEKIRAETSYIEKDMTLLRGPAETGCMAGRSLAWRSGIWSKRGDKSLIGEEFSDISRLKAKTVARGLTSLETEANFSGRERFRAVKKGEIEIDQEYRGNYSIARRVLLSGAARYDRPHITVQKSGQIYKRGRCTVARYIITIQNDGNRVLGPIHVMDRFPAGTEFINSTLRPSELLPGRANWTLTHIPIGGSFGIELNLNLTDERDMLVNIVEASAGYDGRFTRAYNLSAIELNWLGCCPPRFTAYKNATRDQARMDAVVYRLGVRNLANSTVAVQVIDGLPEGLVMLSSSELPEVSSGRIRWIILDVEPGMEKVVEYDAEIPEEGIFASNARFEVYALDGSGMATADESAYISLPDGMDGGVGCEGCAGSCPRSDSKGEETSCPCSDEELCPPGGSGLLTPLDVI